MDTLRIGTKEPSFILPKAGDKLLGLKPGDVVRAQVVRVLSGGELSLRVGGSLIQARIASPVPLGAGVLFRVLGQETDKSGGVGVRLQFLQVADEAAQPPSPISTTPSGPSTNPVAETIKDLVHEFAAHAPFKKEMGEELAVTIRQLLKALPDDPASLPKDLRNQLLSLVQKSLRETEQSIQNRATLLFGEDALQESSDLGEKQPLTLPLFAKAEAILQVPMKTVLGDTGVTLESKLKALAHAMLLNEDRERASELPTGSSRDWPPEAASLGTDLKARLLQLREKILDTDGATSEPETASKSTAPDGSAVGKAVNEAILSVVDGLLRDIETFQLLSKLTHSFYTFLPFLWKGLKEGDIAFKRGRSGGAEQSHYCVMNLDFDALGRITIVAMMQGGELFASFKTANQELRSILEGNIPELKEMFYGEGLRLKGVNFLDADDPHLAPFEHLETFESLLNLKI
jgi:hypothetical protein